MLIGCASNSPNNTFDSNKVISIEKPEIAYDTKRLPENFNVFLFNSETIKEKDFINGLLVNYYYFKNQLNYSPKLNFITSEDLKNNKCSFSNLKRTSSIIFLTEEFLSSLQAYCLNKILSLKSLTINLNDFSATNQNIQVALNFNKRSEYKNLLMYAKRKGNLNALFIEDKNTSNKNILREIWLELDGNVLDSSASNNNKSNQDLLSNILLIENSKQRSRKLSRALSYSLESSPRRRKDVDSIIMSVSISQARNLKPVLEYNFGESLSVYLLPNWNDQDFYLKKELDLEGISVIDLPWMLNSEAPFLKQETKKRSRNFAFGFDAYDVALLLNNPSSLRYFKYTGMTGELIYKNGKLYRKSLKAEIEKGIFKSIGY